MTVLEQICVQVLALDLLFLHVSLNRFQRDLRFEPHAHTQSIRSRRETVRRF